MTRPTMNLPPGLERRADGIFYAPRTAAVSYPDEGNDYCSQIEEDSFWFAHRNRVVSLFVKKYAPGEAFFDIGGGNGFVALGLERGGIPTVLVEPGEAGARNAARRGLPNVVCATMEDAGFGPASIGAAGLFDVVEHIEDDLSFLKKMHEVLRPGGHLFVTVPAFRFLWSNEDVDAGHFRRYTLPGLKKRLAEAGFETAFATYFFSILPLPVFLLRSLPSRLGIHKNSNDLQKYQQEHRQKPGATGSLLDKVWDWELSRFEKGGSIGFGSSCFVVAKRPG